MKTKPHVRARIQVTTLASVLLLAASCDVQIADGTPLFAEAQKQPPIVSPDLADDAWLTVVNNTYTAPGSSRTFNSYNQPSVDGTGVVVFRARTRGGSEQMRARGIYTCDMSDLVPCPNAELEVIADANSMAPPPNNTGVRFIEFPSIPRITVTPNPDTGESLVSTRGQHQPVWEYTPEGELEQTRVGTTGVYTNSGPGGALETAASQVGVVPGFEHFAVPLSCPDDPAVHDPIRFDVFPGAPSPAIAGGDELIVFKGNYRVDGEGETGVFFRRLDGEQAVQLIANTFTLLPNPPPSEPGATFGSTAPPSAHGDALVFVGYIEEAVPTRGGGIYRAPIECEPELATLVEIGQPVPGLEEPAEFTQFGEGLSFDGRYVGFWAAWGADTRSLFLPCPSEGNRDRIEYCNETLPAFPQGCEGEDCLHGMIVEVPVHQGVFVYDTQTRITTMIARTGVDGIVDFRYWNYTGAVPEPETEPDQEPPRFRASAFVAVSAGTKDRAMLAFKARAADYDPDFYGPALGAYVEVVDSLRLGRVIGKAMTNVTVLLRTGVNGRVVDPQAPKGSMVTEIGLERDGLRAPWLAISARMGFEPDAGEEDDGMAGIYLRQVPMAPQSP